MRLVQRYNNQYKAKQKWSLFIRTGQTAAHFNFVAAVHSSRISMWQMLLLLPFAFATMLDCSPTAVSPTTASIIECGSLWRGNAPRTALDRKRWTFSLLRFSFLPHLYCQQWQLNKWLTRDEWMNEWMNDWENVSYFNVQVISLHFCLPHSPSASFWQTLWHPEWEFSWSIAPVRNDKTENGSIFLQRTGIRGTPLMCFGT